jgi:hypothetical protein
MAPCGPPTAATAVAAAADDDNDDDGPAAARGLSATLDCRLSCLDWGEEAGADGKGVPKEAGGREGGAAEEDDVDDELPARATKASWRWWMRCSMRTSWSDAEGVGASGPLPAWEGGGAAGKEDEGKGWECDEVEEEEEGGGPPVMRPPSCVES